jgi:hypothetical protein
MLDHAHGASKGRIGRPPVVCGSCRPRETAVEALGGRAFGAVLCHGVLPYLEGPGPVVSALVALARPSGVVSVVAKNGSSGV